MEINPVTRQRQLESISQLISESKKSVHSILDIFNWIPEKVKENAAIKVTCRYDKRHVVPAASIENHEKMCELSRNGYNVKEAFLPECTDNKQHSIYIDNEKKQEILSSAQKSVHNFKTGWNGTDPDPKTSDRLTSTFTSDERLALYDFAVKNTKGPSQLPEFNVVHPAVKDEKELTYEEILEQERNAKRRRMKYKTVHTSNKNSSEVMRDVINNQMELYKEWLLEKEEIEDRRKSSKRERSESSHRQRRRSRSRYSKK